MITLFSIPKPPLGHIGMIQANAVRSWKRLHGCEVVLFGSEEGLAEFAKSLRVRHMPQIGRNESGTPLISEAFEQAVQLAKTPLVAYVNADILLMDDFVGAARAVSNSGLRDFLMVGQRHDINIREPLDFTEHWEANLRRDVAQRGVLHGKAGIDYFLFRRNFPVKMPAFAVGRPGWDSWLIHQTLSLRIPLIDATGVVIAVHQNHPPAYQSFGDEALRNAQLAGGFANMGTIRDANWSLTKDGLRRLPFGPRLLSAIASSSLGRAALAIKRRLQFGLGRLRNRH